MYSIYRITIFPFRPWCKNPISSYIPGHRAFLCLGADEYGHYSDNQQKMYKIRGK